MTIEVPAADLYALGAALRSSSTAAADAGSRLAGSPTVGGPLQQALDGFLECHRAATHALAGELDWLGHTVTSVADSWLQLDGSLLPPHGQVGRR